MLTIKSIGIVATITTANITHHRCSFSNDTDVDSITVQTQFLYEHIYDFHKNTQAFHKKTHGNVKGIDCTVLGAETVNVLLTVLLAYSRN